MCHVGGFAWHLPHSSKIPFCGCPPNQAWISLATSGRRKETCGGTSLISGPFQGYTHTERLVIQYFFCLLSLMNIVCTTYRHSPASHLHASFFQARTRPRKWTAGASASKWGGTRRTASSVRGVRSSGGQQSPALGAQTVFASHAVPHEPTEQGIEAGGAPAARNTRPKRPSSQSARRGLTRPKTSGVRTRPKLNRGGDLSAVGHGMGHWVQSNP